MGVEDSGTRGQGPVETDGMGRRGGGTEGVATLSKQRVGTVRCALSCCEGVGEGRVFGDARLPRGGGCHLPDGFPAIAPEPFAAES